MYAGIISKKRSIKKLGIHQRFDTAAYRMISGYLKPGTFPTLSEILHFEGVNGPDGLKVKDSWVEDCNHLYDPKAGEGDVPRRINSHYNRLVHCLKDGDLTRASFEASWLAHFITDGLTPAHHHPLDKLKAELFGPNSSAGLLKRHFQYFGKKGSMSTHANFEVGTIAALLLFPLRMHLDSDKLAQARRLGLLEFFRQEALDIDEHKLYDKFCLKGWTSDIARSVRNVIAPQVTQVIGVVWLLAHLEASQSAVPVPKLAHAAG